MKTWKNKAIALGLVGIGAISTLLDGDGTFLVFAIIIGLPLFLSKRSWIPQDYADYIIREDGTVHKVEK